MNVSVGLEIAKTIVQLAQKLKNHEILDKTMELKVFLSELQSENIRLVGENSKLKQEIELLRSEKKNQPIRTIQMDRC